MMQPLYKTKNNFLYPYDFWCSLKEVGINKGDTIFIHSDISVFGKLAVLERNILMQSLVDVMKESVGVNGTIIMPVFSYSFCNNEIYDPVSTKSKVGTLSEFFRKQADVSRTIQPIFSVAIWGEKKEQLLNVGGDSFDSDSIFGKLHQIKGKILFFGAPVHSCTYIHYIEQSHGVPYRYIKTFKGKISINGVIHKDQCTYFVRRLDQNVILDTLKLENHLFTKGLIKKSDIGGGSIQVVEADVLFKEGYKLLDQDINYFLKI